MPVTARLPEREGTCDVMSDHCAEIWLVVARVMSTLPPNPEKDPGRPAVSSHAFGPYRLKKRYLVDRECIAQKTTRERDNEVVPFLF